ncbi:hypothetical protein ACJ73_01766 [Blastomyces percursus]|uniref:Uncharacterized protein n=1 Tax=Blastomyces percursus TaxID=1658174 RepID=A0A1J9RGS9_9EURO|nr:hypothetical protein ACJ73_01766 [Blastomyces percursus]
MLMHCTLYGSRYVEPSPGQQEHVEHISLMHLYGTQMAHSKFWLKHRLGLMEDAPPDPTVHGLPVCLSIDVVEVPRLILPGNAPRVIYPRLDILGWASNAGQPTPGDDYQYRSLDIVLSCIGFSAANIPHVTPLKYSTYELMVQISKRDLLTEVFQHNAYDPFDKESPLVRVLGLKESVGFVVRCYNNMESQYTWPGVKKWLHDRVIELQRRNGLISI